MKSISGALLAIASFAGQAEACDNSPGPLEFVGTTSDLAYSGSEALEFYAQFVKNGDDRDILVVFHEPKPSSATIALREARSRTIRQFWSKQGMAASRLVVTATSKPPPSTAAGAIVTIEFSNGCNG